MRAAIWLAPGELEIGRREDPVPGPRDVVVAAIEAGAGAVRRGGRLMVFGVAPAEATMRLSPFRIPNDEITVLGSMAVLHSFGPALDLMAAGASDTAAMLSHDFPLEGFGDALEVVRSGGGVKAQVLPQAG